MGGLIGNRCPLCFNDLKHLAQKEISYASWSQSALYGEEDRSFYEDDMLNTNTPPFSTNFTHKKK